MTTQDKEQLKEQLAAMAGLTEPSVEQFHERLGAQAPVAQAVAAIAPRLAAGVGAQEDGEQLVFVATGSPLRNPSAQILDGAAARYSQTPLDAVGAGMSAVAGLSVRKVRDAGRFADDLEEAARRELPEEEPLGPLGDPRDPHTRVVLEQPTELAPAPAPDEDGILREVVREYFDKPDQQRLVVDTLAQRSDQRREEAQATTSRATKAENELGKRLASDPDPIWFWQKGAVELFTTARAGRIEARALAHRADVLTAGRKAADGLRQAPARVAKGDEQIRAEITRQAAPAEGNRYIETFDLDQALAQMAIPSTPSVEMVCTLLAATAADKLPAAIAADLLARARVELRPYVPDTGTLSELDARPEDAETDAEVIDAVTEGLNDLIGELYERAAGSGIFVTATRAPRNYVVVGGPTLPPLDPLALDAEIVHVPDVPELADYIVVLSLFPVAKHELAIYQAGQAVLATKADVSTYYATPEMRAHVARLRAVRPPTGSGGAPEPDPSRSGSPAENGSAAKVGR